MDQGQQAWVGLAPELPSRLFALAHEPKQFVRFAGGGHDNLDAFGAIETAKRFIAS